MLRLSLVSVPVQAFNAQESGAEGKITLHQLHDKDKSRIRYVKVCPVHGEVPSSEIVSGYEVSKDEYVVIDPAELDEVRTPAEKAITLDSFVAPELIDPLQFDGRNYYLVPDGEAGAKPYIVLHRAMVKQGTWAVGQAVMFSREHLVLVRPHGELLQLSLLHYAGEMRDGKPFDIGEAKITAAEVQLAETLIKASTSKKFDITKYRDSYADKLRALIAAKVEGREIVAAPAEDEPVVVNLMDALRQSVAKAQRKPAAKAAKPPKKMAASRRVGGAAKRRKSS